MSINIQSGDMLMCGFLVFTSNSNSLKGKEESFYKIQHRGPDQSSIVDLHEKGWFGFHRLAIMDLSSNGNQPFEDKNFVLVSNGEIYNYSELKHEYSHYSFTSTSDIEVLLPLLKDRSLVKANQTLDGEYAFVVYDKENNLFYAARDPMGIRPMFYGYDENGSIAFASEVKALKNYCKEIKPFPPGFVYDGNEFVPFKKLYESTEHSDNEEQVLTQIHDLLSHATIKRLNSDAPVGFLLSGGLDSSLVCSIAAKYLNQPIKTFSVGIEDGPIDTTYAQVVADYLGTDHTTYLFSKKDIKNHLKELVYHLETFDVTTIRASMGMSLICKYIKENTNVKVLMTGECSDEIFGYKYTDYAPNATEFQKEAERRVKELYLYDVLRADRCIAMHSIEARVPFSDSKFIDYVMGINPEMKMNTTGIGKYLLRKAFEKGDYLPHDILYREKAAFSDAVGHSSVDYLKQLAEEQYTNKEFKSKSKKFKHITPKTKEELFYREIFEEFYLDMGKLIPSIWLPNQNWENCNVTDPSARVLPNYKDSGKALNKKEN